MDWGTIVDRISSTSIEFFIYGEKGRVLTSQEILFFAVIIAVGALWCFLGLKLVRFWSALIGLAVGFAIGSFAAEILGMENTVVYAAGAILGMILLVLCARFYRFGVFVCVWCVGAVSTACFINPKNWIWIAVCTAVGLILALISVKATEIIVMIVTAFFGAMAVESAAAFLLPIQGMAVEIVIGAVLGAAGVLVQLLLESKKRKKLSLKKAAEIRDTQSTENEVEKARAMMENLDSITEKKEESDEEET